MNDENPQETQGDMLVKHKVADLGDHFVEPVMVEQNGVGEVVDAPIGSSLADTSDKCSDKKEVGLSPLPIVASVKKQSETELCETNNVAQPSNTVYNCGESLYGMTNGGNTDQTSNFADVVKSDKGSGDIMWSPVGFSDTCKPDPVITPDQSAVETYASQKILRPTTNEEISETNGNDENVWTEGTTEKLPKLDNVNRKCNGCVSPVSEQLLSENTDNNFADVSTAPDTFATSDLPKTWHQMNGTDFESTSNSVLEAVDTEGCVMQRVVEGTLRPMNFHSSPAFMDPPQETNLFAAVSETSLSQDLVPGLIAGSSLNVVESEGLNGGMDVNTQLTDLSTSSLHFQTIVNTAPEIQPSPVIIVPDSKPSFVKMLPLKNGDVSWTMEELRQAIAQNGSIFLKLCATPEAANGGPPGTFGALFLDVCEAIEEPLLHISRKRKISVDEEDNPLSPSLKKQGMTTWPSVSSIRSDGSDIITPQCTPDYFEQQTGIASSPVMKSPSKSNLHIPLSSPKMKKRGRPALHGQGDLIGEIPLEALSSVLDTNSGTINMSTLQNSIIGSMLPKRLKADKSCSGEEQQIPVGYKRLLSLTCVQCGSVFRNKSGLASHVKSKHKVFKMCHTCNKKVHLQDKYSFRRHLLKTHRDKSQLTCHKCTVSFKVMLHLKRHDRIVHEDSESSGLSSCEIGSDSEKEDTRMACESEKSKEDGQQITPEKTFRKEETFKKKELLETKNDTLPAEERFAKCTKSEKLAESIGEKEEKKSMESGLEEADESEHETDAEDSSGSELEEVEEKKKYFCTECDSGFSHKFKLNFHIQEKHTQNNDTDDFEVDPESLVCNTCKKHCRNAKQFEQHLAQHERRGNTSDKKKYFSRPLEQKQEDQRMPKNARLKMLQLEANKIMGKPKKRVGRPPRQQKLEESELVPECKKNNEWPPYVSRKGRVYHCTKCRVSFPREKSMTYHLKKIHETLYPFRACPDCSKVFRSSGPYIRHVSQHKVKNCPIAGCKTRYKNSRLIRKHQKSAHPEFPYRCSRCIQLYQKSSQLEKHKAEEHPQTESMAGDADDSEEESEEEEEDEKEVDSTPKKELVLPSKRVRNVPVSYKEVDEDEDSLGRKRRKFTKPKVAEPLPIPEQATPLPSPPSKKRKFLRKFKVQKDRGATKSVPEAFTKFKKVKKLAALKNKLHGVQFKQRTTKASSKKITTSWTAALKAKYNFSKKGYYKKPEKSDLEKKSPTEGKTTPAVDVIRRVTESLLQRQKMVTSPTPETPKEQVLPSVLASTRENSVRKPCDDSLLETPAAETDPKSTKASDTDDGNVLRFDYF